MLIHGLRLVGTCVLNDKRRRCKAIFKIRREIHGFLCNQDLLEAGGSCVAETA